MVPGRSALHIDLFRVRAMHGVLEPWARPHVLHGILAPQAKVGPPPLPLAIASSSVADLESQVKKLRRKLKDKAMGPAGNLFQVAAGKKRKKDDEESEESDTSPLFRRPPLTQQPMGYKR